jgi:hypothetical protein
MIYTCTNYYYLYDKIALNSNKKNRYYIGFSKAEEN